jgi:transcription elongation factor Elf1
VSVDRLDSKSESSQRKKPRCPRCGSTRWVSVSLNGGYTRQAQCVPCGAYHPGNIGPGWKSPRYNDPDAVHPDYRK